jgi:hypothetical protein
LGWSRNAGEQGLSWPPCYSNDGPHAWGQSLAQVTLAYNTAQQTTTGYSPFELLYGVKPRLNSDRNLPTVEIGGIAIDEDTTIYNLARVNQMTVNREVAKKRIVKVQSATKKRYDSKVTKNAPTLKTGQKVWVRNSMEKTRFDVAFKPKWSGPFEIDADLNNGAFLVNNRYVHRDRLRPYIEPWLSIGDDI